MAFRSMLAYAMWTIFSLLTFLGLLIEALLWLFGSGRVHNCGLPNSGVNLYLTADEYASCILKTDVMCSNNRDNQAIGTLFVALSILYVVLWYAFQYRFVYVSSSRFYASAPLSRPWAEALDNLPTRNAIFSFIICSVHALAFLVLIQQDSPVHITSRACGNIYAAYIWPLSLAVVIVALLHVLVVWWYVVNTYTGFNHNGHRCDCPIQHTPDCELDAGGYEEQQLHVAPPPPPQQHVVVQQNNNTFQSGYGGVPQMQQRFAAYQSGQLPATIPQSRATVPLSQEELSRILGTSANIYK